MLTVRIFTGSFDYDSGPYTVTFPTGVISAQFDVPIFDDDILEDDESFTLTISAELLANHITCGTTGETTVIIFDVSS